MNNTIDTEVVEEPKQTALATRPSMAVGQALGVDEIVAQVKLIQDVMHRVMKEGEHFGVVPGCGTKKTLLQPGAQKLTMTFRLAPAYEIQEVNLERGHKEYRVICTLKSMGSGSFVGQGVGCCSSMESKYRWRVGSRKCPECGKEAIIKGKAEYGGGWVCFNKKGGCGAKWPDGAKEIEGQSIERVENPDPADTFNTVLKMAKKRAFVDATITATAASDIFTQDIGDAEEDEAQTPPKSNAAPPTTHQKAKDHHPSTPAKPAANGPKEATEATKKWFLKEVYDIQQDALQFFIELGVILPNETLEDIPLNKIPTSRTALAALRDNIAKFKATGKAEKPKSAEPQGGFDFDAADAPWRAFPVPFGKSAGVTLDKLPKNTLFGFWANYKVETEYNGKPLAADKVAKNQAFRDALDEAGKHYEFSNPNE